MMRCYHYKLNRILRCGKIIEGVVFAKGITEAKKQVIAHVKNNAYMMTWDMPLSMIIYTPVDITESGILDMSRED